MNKIDCMCYATSLYSWRIYLLWSISWGHIAVIDMNKILVHVMPLTSIWRIYLLWNIGRDYIAVINMNKILAYVMQLVYMKDIFSRYICDINKIRIYIV